MAEQRIDVAQELREQSIDVLSAGAEQNIEIDSEPSVLHGIDGVSPIATVTQTETGATISITDRDGTTTATITNGQDGERGATGATGATGPAGSDGADGFSPTATVTKSGKVATITITDKNGTTTQTISDGNDGQNGQNGEDGFSPTASVTKSGDTATITITDKNGTTTAQVKDGTGASITVDSALSSSSTNPVQNKVINSALNAKVDSSDIPTKTSDLTNDSNFAVDASYTHTDNNFTTTYKNRLDTLTDSYIISLISDGTEVSY